MSLSPYNGSESFDHGRPCGSRTMGGHAGPAELEVPPYKQRRTYRLTKAISLTEDDMRAFSLQPSISLAKFALSFSQPRRARSEPATSVPRPHGSSQVLTSTVVSNNSLNTNGHSSERVSRSPSLAPTEVDDPEPEVILEELKSLNIKVRDYAYPVPPIKASPTGPPPSATEIFDPWRGMSEYMYRLSQSPRIQPIAGKTMRRLLELGWVQMDEAKARLHQIDWEAMKEYDAKDIGYPWRPMTWKVIPSDHDRQILFEVSYAYFVSLDKVRAQLQWEDEQRELERLRGLEVDRCAQLLIQENEKKNVMERQRLEEERRNDLAEKEGGMGMVFPAEDNGYDDDDENWVPSIRRASSPMGFRAVLEGGSTSSGKKRALEHTSSTPNSTTDGAKRARLSGAPSSPPNAVASSSRVPPAQQYPAALQSYDPQLYPDAARIIAAEDRPPVVLPDPVTPPISDDEDDDRPGVRLQKKKKGLKRTLSRTQTFTQL